MALVSDILNLALLDSGVIGQGQTASDADLTNAMTRANYMLSQWQVKRWLIWALQDVAFVSTGAQSYTVGTGQDFDIQRPNRLEDGNFMRQLNTNSGQEIDFTPLKLIFSKEAYNRIPLKAMGTFPWCVFYDPQWPAGQVYFYPVPEATIYELHILVRTPLTAFVNLTDTIVMPNEYEAALLYNLQVRLRAAYRLPPDPVIIGLATDSLNLIRNANAQVPTMRMPARLVRRGYAYNLYSDNN